MKKFLLLLVVLSAGLIAEGQITMPKVPSTQDLTNSALKNFIAPPAIGDLGKTTSGITDKLMSSLGLASGAKSGLSSLIGGFLKEKQGFLGLAKTDPAQYLSKFSPLQSGLFGKLKSQLGEAVFSKFLGLKPAGGDATNILSNLFF